MAGSPARAGRVLLTHTQPAQVSRHAVPCCAALRGREVVLGDMAAAGWSCLGFCASSSTHHRSSRLVPAWGDQQQPAVSAASARNVACCCCCTFACGHSIKAIGYDMDYTLIHYDVNAWEVSERAASGQGGHQCSS